MGQLAQKVKEKYPGVYDGKTDAEIESAITKKYPGKYDNLAEAKKPDSKLPPNITLPDGSIVSSLYKGGMENRKDRRIIDTDKLRESMINFASKTPFPKTAGIIGDIGVQALELGNDPESIAGAGMIAKRLIPKPMPEIVVPPITPSPFAGSGSLEDIARIGAQRAKAKADEIRVQRIEIPANQPIDNVAAVRANMSGNREVLPIKPEVSTLPTRAQANEAVKQAKTSGIPEAPKRIRTSDPSQGRSIMQEIEAMPKTMPQVSAMKATDDVVDEGSKSLGKIRGTISEARALQTSLDLSAPLRQGSSLMHTKEFWTSLKPMFQSAASEEGFKKVMGEIQTRGSYNLMNRAGVEFTDLTANLAKREEQLRGTLVEKWIPGVKQSNRAYTAFLNKLRADTFDRLVNEAGKDGAILRMQDDANESSKAIAKFVNDATGRGSLGSWEKSAVALNDVFFSPKLIASRVNMLRRGAQATIETITRTGADDVVAKKLRMEALKSMMTTGTLASVSIGLSVMGGAEGTEDPRSTDFGKIKIGNTRIDMTGGFQSYLRASAQIASGQANIEGELQDRNRGDTAARFLRTKLSPVVSTIVDLLYGKDVIGQDVTLLPTDAKQRGELLGLITPLILDDLIEVAMEDPKMIPITAPTSFFGAGVQSYGRDSDSKMPSLTMPSMGEMPSLTGSLK